MTFRIVKQLYNLYTLIMNHLHVKTRFILCIFITYFSCPIFTASAQMTTVDSLFLQKTIAQTVAAYHAAIGEGSALFNGPKYADYPKIKDGGHAFFNAVTPSKCTIVYDNVFYPSVNLLYDEVTGVVVVQDATRRIQLETDKITAFTIWDNRFTRLTSDSTNAAGMPKGFYQILYEGKINVFKRETKRIEEDIRSASDGIIRSIIVKKAYFFQKKGIYYEVRDKKSVLSFFDDKKKEVAQFIKRNKLDFDKDADNALVKVAAFYDALP
jgi:hypothetical protein